MKKKKLISNEGAKTRVKAFKCTPEIAELLEKKENQSEFIINCILKGLSKDNYMPMLQR